MLEINPQITDSNELERIIEKKLIEKNIPSELKFKNLSVLLSTLKQNFAEMNSKWNIHEIEIKSQRPIIGKIIVFSKKVFRKLTRWLFSTYYRQQSEFNAATLKTIINLINIQEKIVYELSKRE